MRKDDGSADTTRIAKFISLWFFMFYVLFACTIMGVDGLRYTFGGEVDFEKSITIVIAAGVAVVGSMVLPTLDYRKHKRDKNNSDN